MIQLTVALPLFNAQNIAWLALESLCRQKDIDFKWELIVCEENNKQRFGDINLMLFEKRLKEVGCQRIVYLPIQKWIPLGNKWVEIAKSASHTKGFLLQAGDCYSQPYRLKESFDLFEKLGDWVQSPFGIFYDVRLKKSILYDYHKNPWNHPCALNMALRTDLMKKIKPAGIPRGVDGWLFSQAKNINGGVLNSVLNLSENWKLGADTNGYNNISVNRGKYFKNISAPFKETSITIDSCLPADILQRLNAL